MSPLCSTKETEERETAETLFKTNVNMEVTSSAIG
jgi:hypothetical protein